MVSVKILPQAYDRYLAAIVGQGKELATTGRWVVSECADQVVYVGGGHRTKNMIARIDAHLPPTHVWMIATRYDQVLADVADWHQPMWVPGVFDRSACVLSKEVGQTRVLRFK